MKKIKVSKVFVSLVSDVDFPELSKNKWFHSSGYARHNRLGQMHRIVMKEMLQGEIPKGLQVDHINRNKMDNRRENLRLATASENQINSGEKIGKSGFRGVTPHRRKWHAKIQKDGLKIYIGLYDTPEKAALAYNEKAKELFGDFSYQNVV